MEEEYKDTSFLDATEFQKLFGHDPGKDNYVIKLAIVGYPGVGKSSFIKQFCDQVVPLQHIPSMNIEITSEVIKVSSSTIVKVFLYEVAGQTQYIDIKSLFVCGIQGIIVMYANHYPYTFEKIPDLLRFINKHFVTNVPKLLIGNIFENHEKIISWQQGKDLADHFNMDYNEINVIKSLSNIDRCIGYFISKIIKD